MGGAFANIFKDRKLTIETNHFFAEMRTLVGKCGSNKHSQAIVLAAACIEHGFNTRSRILGAAEEVGLNRRHIAKILQEGTGPDPERHHWQRDAEGHYTMND